jgi:selenocysteine-specific elongation factor
MLSNLVVGTAGHIDHGKTSLVRALTGVDLDQLPEEKERGITIALGFTPYKLGSGRQLAFVDVPGHERLVRTMVAGATGLDAVLLCVSAVEGVMPQTREHLAILGLLGIERGVVALTMADLADDEMLELARLDVLEAVEGTLLESAPVIATSALTRRGLDTLTAALEALPDAHRSTTEAFRLPVDRAFVRRGFGTVATGTARSGRLSDGEDVEVLPSGVRARVRGIEVHGEAVTETLAGQRTAVNLAGIERDDLHRGEVIVRAGTITPTSIVDARVSMLAGAPSIEGRVRVLLGTSEAMATVSVLDAAALFPGRTHYVQLRTEHPLVALPGDRFVLRRESPVSTIGGGVVLDPWARRTRARDHARALAECEALDRGERWPFLRRAGDAGLSREDAAARAVEGVTLGDRVLDAENVAALERAFLAALGAWHAAHPLRPGIPRRDLHRGPLAALSERAFDALAERLAAGGRVAFEGPLVRDASFAIALDHAETRALAAMSDAVRAAGLEGVEAGALLAQSADLLHLLLERKEAERVGDRVLHGTVLATLATKVRAFVASRDTMTPSDFKELTGLSRKHAIPLLEWLDRSRITVRVGDDRKLAHTP